mmetsp:Transcript_14317/g.56346  ORF Transcript_14317/g.56346 Transcript_14317/m.56346 type:complete len:395 (-) Transcript_14317:300-1484(-)
MVRAVELDDARRQFLAGHLLVGEHAREGTIRGLTGAAEAVHLDNDLRGLQTDSLVWGIRLDGAEYRRGASVCEGIKGRGNDERLHPSEHGGCVASSCARREGIHFHQQIERQWRETVAGACSSHHGRAACSVRWLLWRYCCRAASLSGAIALLDVHLVVLPLLRHLQCLHALTDSEVVDQRRVRLHRLRLIHRHSAILLVLVVLLPQDCLVLVPPPAVRLVLALERLAPPSLAAHHRDTLIGLIVLELERLRLVVHDDQLHTHPRGLLPLDAIVLEVLEPAIEQEGEASLDLLLSQSLREERASGRDQLLEGVAQDLREKRECSEAECLAQIKSVEVDVLLRYSAARLVVLALKHRNEPLQAITGDGLENVLVQSLSLREHRHRRRCWVPHHHI